MSALRLSRPGYATELRVIDDGASPYRRGYAIGGSLVTERVPPPRIVPATSSKDRADGDDRHAKDPDNGAVKATEYRGPT